MSNETKADGESALHRRRITLEDGRYLIFYTFDAEDAPHAESAGVSKREPQARPVAEEERRV